MNKYLIRPLEHGIASQYPSVGIPGTFAPATNNVKSLRNSIRKRWGYESDRDLGAGVTIQGTTMFQVQDGTRYTIIFTDTDICKRETETNKTFSYLTPMYSTGTVTVSGTAVTGSGTAWSGNVSPGDKFICTTDWTSDEEPDANWATIDTVGSDTSITLAASYTGAATGPGANYRIRKLYSVPSGERWEFCWVGKASGNYLVAVNGDVDAQYWDGSAASFAAIDTEYGVAARYCKAFGDRLILADKGDETNANARNPFLLSWSTVSNPIDLDYSDDSSAGRKSFTETSDFITGLGVAGSTIVVFKRDGIHLGYSTEDATAPFAFPSYRPGVGCIAPYSIIEAMGTVFWLGENDFYKLEGDQAIAMGENAIYKIYDVINETEAQNVWGFVNQIDHELLWVASSTGGAAQYIFSWDYKYNEWNMYTLAEFITGAGTGAI